MRFVIRKNKNGMFRARCRRQQQDPCGVRTHGIEGSVAHAAILQVTIETRGDVTAKTKPGLLQFAF